jgi:CubicO group peptidase (beta-lactamase class C family)
MSSARSGSLSGMQEILERYVKDGAVPGAVALVARGERVEVAVAGSLDTGSLDTGSLDTGGTAPMARDSIFRIASLTKPIIAAAAMVLVQDGRIALDDPVARWLPELAAPMVVRTPASPVDDVVPAARPVTLFDLLTFRAGYGFPSDFSLPALQPLFTDLKQGPPNPQHVAPPDEWMATLARIPMLHQPGAAWLYNTCADILGVLIARVSDDSLPDFLASRLFEPLGMADTGFWVPAAKLGRLTSYYGPDRELLDAPDGQWSSPPPFPSGGGGLVSTADDCLAFGRMLLAGGGPVLTPESVRQMTTDRLTATQRDAGRLFLEGDGWGFGGSVNLESGRYGWVGGTGTSAHVTFRTSTVAILLSQVQMSGPTPPPLMRDFWRYAGQ